ncbi:hypothetical protein ACFSTC_27785 [Nonomuraea ferruginea]
MVTVSPDVASSTNAGGWINRVGVWSPRERHDWFAEDGDRLIRWRESPRSQHIELGIAEVNLMGLLGELGATWLTVGEPLLPIGTIYDPFVGRALEPWSFGTYAGGRSILVGTPSGGHARRGGRRAPECRHPPRSACSSPVSPPTNRPSPWRPSGACCTRCPGSAGPTASRPTCASPRGRSTRNWPPCLTTPSAGSGDGVPC